MKTLLTFILLVAMSFSAATATDRDRINYTANFKMGKVEMTSISSLTFGPEGILFMGDPLGAKVFALDTKDNTAKEVEKPASVDKLDAKLASMLGTTVENVTIHDMAVNRASKNIYFSVSRNDSPLLIRLMPDGKMEEVALENVMHSQVGLLKPVEEKEDRWGRNMRNFAITDLAYHNGNLYIAGLSNEEFSSTFRTIPFPFEKEQKLNALEIYHAAHGKYETNSPIKAFLPVEMGGKPHIVASYTCTPLVTFPVDALDGKEKVMGKTVAELGNRNTPLDIINIDGEDPFILIANSNRTMMKVKHKDMLEMEDGLTERVERHGTDGVKFLALAEVGVQQLDDYNKDYIVLLQRHNNGSLNLRHVSKKRL